jgi:hypothetical protein
MDRKMSKTYRTQFEKGVKLIYRVVQENRLWATDSWNDTEAGQGKEIKVLEYACGPGIVSTVSPVSPLHGDIRN